MLMRALPVNYKIKQKKFANIFKCKVIEIFLSFFAKFTNYFFRILLLPCFISCCDLCFFLFFYIFDMSQILSSLLNLFLLLTCFSGFNVVFFFIVLAYIPKKSSSWYFDLLFVIMVSIIQWSWRLLRIKILP